MSPFRLLIDGYNVLAPIAPPSRGMDEGWLGRERKRLIDRLVKGLGEKTRQRTCLVFDAANPPRDRPSEFEVDGLVIRFAVGYAEADDLLEVLIASNSAPKNLAVVSSDGRVRLAARRRGCTVYEAQPWLDDLLEGVVGLADGRKPLHHREQFGESSKNSSTEDEIDPDQRQPVDAEEVQNWMRKFGF